ncbi:MAG: hypothetical protein ABL989_14065 [Gammaproteobacteria bacterium]
MTNAIEHDPTRWYRLPIMWLVVALPLLAFVGGGLMVALTILQPDVEVHSERIMAPAAADAPGT